MAGLTIDIDYDSSVADAPAGFETTVAAAVSYLESLFSTAITVTIDVGYGEVDGSSLGDDLGESRSTGIVVSYSQLRSALLARTATETEVEAGASLPASNPTGDGTFYLSYAEAEALDLSSGPPGDQPVGEIGLSNSFPFTYGTSNGAASGTYDAFGVIEHEITEVLGRTAMVGEGGSYTPLDLFRYASPGVRSLTPGAASFSVNGTDLLAAFNNSAENGGDPGDWAASVTDDSFDASSQPGVANVLSATDLTVMDAIGYSPVGGNPVISGTVAGQTITDQQTARPFSGVTITDSNYQPTETVTVTLSDAANGTLTSLGGGSYDGARGVYTVSGTAAQVTAALQALVFDPTMAQAPGQTVTTSFTIADADSAGGSAADTTTSVAVTDITDDLHAPSGDFAIANDDGTLDLQTGGSSGTLPGVTVMAFTDGTGVFDPTGAAEDIARLYGAALDRAPDIAGLEYWTGQVDDANVPLVSVSNSFAASPEFIADYGSLTNAQYVDQLYENVLGRSADQAGASYWEGQLADGASRGAVLLGFAESQEYETDTQAITSSNTRFAAGDQDNGEIYRLYEAALDRAPDPTGQAYWVGALQSGASMTDIAQSVVDSAEFQSDYGNPNATDFVTLLYNNVLGRAPDSAGLAYWTGELNQGVSRATVVLGFSDSVEFRLDTAAATHANWVFVPS